MTVRDILEMQGGSGEQPLGSVVFSESFMDSSINIHHKGELPYLLGAEKHNTEQQEDKLNMTTCWQLLCCSCRWQREPRHLLHHPDSQCSSLCLLSSGCLSAFLVHFLSFPLTPWCFLFFQQLEFDVALTKEAQHLAQVHEGTGSK